MASLKELKNRIGSVKSTQKITRAKQMVAAAKFRRAQEAALAARPYAHHMAATVANLARAALDGAGGPQILTGTGRSDTHMLIVMTAERGLCGGFNANIVKTARQQVKELQAAGKTVKIVTVGKKGREALKGDCRDLFVDHVDLGKARDNFVPFAISLGNDLGRRFDAGEFDGATLVFAQFRNVLTQMPVARPLIPVADTLPADAEPGGPSADYIHEPSEEQILTTLLPRHVKTQILACMLENAVGEQAASMTAMDNATRNAGDLIERLTLQYNRARQAQITKELIEVISGAEAV